MSEEDTKNNRLAFKGGGDQMYDCDIALFYQFVKDPKANPNDWKRKLICRKNRQDEYLFAIEDLNLYNASNVVETVYVVDKLEQTII